MISQVKKLAAAITKTLESKSLFFGEGIMLAIVGAYTGGLMIWCAFGELNRTHKILVAIGLEAAMLISYVPDAWKRQKTRRQIRLLKKVNQELRREVAVLKNGEHSSNLMGSDG